MVAELVMLVLMLAGWIGGKATDLANNNNYSLDLKATYLVIQNDEPNSEKQTYKGMDIKATYLMVHSEKLKQKPWSNQCMRDERMESSYNKNFENEIYEGHGRRKTEEKVTRSYENNSYVEVEQKEGHYLMDGVYMNVEGEMNEYDKGLKEDTIDGKDLATMNRFYEYVNEVVYMVNFVYSNLDEYLTAELYMVVTLVGALMWRLKRRSTKRKMIRSHWAATRRRLCCGCQWHDL